MHNIILLIMMFNSPVLSFSLLYKSYFWVCGWNPPVTVKIKLIERYVPVLLVLFSKDWLSFWIRKGLSDSNQENHYSLLINYADISTWERGRGMTKHLLPPPPPPHQYLLSLFIQHPDVRWMSFFWHASQRVPVTILLYFTLTCGEKGGQLSEWSVSLTPTSSSPKQLAPQSQLHC